MIEMPFNRRQMKTGTLTRQKFDNLPELNNPAQLRFFQGRYYKVKIDGQWLIGDCLKGEFLIPKIRP